jgi:hypothetical protein
VQVRRAQRPMHRVALRTRHAHHRERQRKHTWVRNLHCGGNLRHSTCARARVCVCVCVCACMGGARVYVCAKARARAWVGEK